MTASIVRFSWARDFVIESKVPRMPGWFLVQQSTMQSSHFVIAVSPYTQAKRPRVATENSSAMTEVIVACSNYQDTVKDFCFPATLPMMRILGRNRQGYLVIGKVIGDMKYSEIPLRGSSVCLKGDER